jgi:hypothetical protein
VIKQRIEDRSPADPKIRGAATVMLSIVLARHYRLAPLVLTILLFSLVACGGSAAPEPNDINGAVEGGAAYLLLEWPEGDHDLG